MKHREFSYDGQPVPELNEREHAAFFMNFQRWTYVNTLDKKSRKIMLLF